MKLSIITICYNIKNEIERTCESIVNQTFQEFEWIVVDGGSTDGTLDILEKYKDRINVLISEKDNGVFDAMNKGVLQACGEYLNFMNGGDTYYAVDTLEKCIRLIGSADIHYGHCHSVDSGYITRNPELLPSDYFLHKWLVHQATFIRRNLFEQYGLYMNVAGSDIHKWVVFQKSNCVFKSMDHIVCSYQGGGQSSTVEYYNRLRELLEQYYTLQELANYKINNFDFNSILAPRIELRSEVQIPKANKEEAKLYYKLFNFIPLIKIEKKNKRITYYLFNQLPIFTIRKNE